MSRHTSFRYCLDPTVEQQAVLARHAGAARFAFNKSLDFVKTALTQRKTDPDHSVPWTGYTREPTFAPSWREPTTPEKGGACNTRKGFQTRCNKYVAAKSGKAVGLSP
ncbi:helix-turn-helix domain-containing protein [Nocardia pseudovaccinii]|uniref:helix-turn-helix domain-containing protein n=1 Tax=Nocardia pseudovaccinii TaxID=189540 RepID=UPI003D8F05DC